MHLFIFETSEIISQCRSNHLLQKVRKPVIIEPKRLLWIGEVFESSFRWNQSCDSSVAVNHFVLLHMNTEILYYIICMHTCIMLLQKYCKLMNWQFTWVEMNLLQGSGWNDKTQSFHLAPENKNDNKNMNNQYVSILNADFNQNQCLWTNLFCMSPYVIFKCFCGWKLKYKVVYMCFDIVFVNKKKKYENKIPFSMNSYSIWQTYVVFV